VSKGPRIDLIVTGPGAGPAGSDIDDLAGRARNARPVMQSIIRRLTQIEQAEFASEGAYAGNKWRAKKDSTKARQKRAGRSDDRAMRFTGDLEESLTRDKGGGNAIRRSSKQAATFGTRLYYAGFQDVQLIDVTRRDIGWMADAIGSWLLHGDA